MLQHHTGHQEKIRQQHSRHRQESEFNEIAEIVGLVLIPFVFMIVPAILFLIYLILHPDAFMIDIAP